MAIEILRDNVLARVVVEKKAIDLPEELQIKRKMEATHGIVTHIGPECETCKVGDEILYKAYVGNVVEHDELPKGDDLYIVISENDILMVVRNEG